MRKIVRVGSVLLGGDSPIVIQSMTNTATSDINATLNQINTLYSVGCAIVRLAISSATDITASKKIISRSSVPLVADIQFDYRLAIQASNAGFSGIRFNPGNIGTDEKVKKLVDACIANKTTIRIGTNLGSLEKEFEKKHGRTATALVNSTLKHVTILEKYGFNDIVLSAKSSNAKIMIDANRELYQKTNYPLHIGVTESGIGDYGTIKSAIGIGSLLADGIGDTIRVSLTGDPVKEIEVAKMILKASGRNSDLSEVISCPTCARCQVDLAKITLEISDYVRQNKIKNCHIAVMGCIVNGPGEAKDANLTLCAGKDKCVLYKDGKIAKTVLNENVLDEFKKMIYNYSV